MANLDSPRFVELLPYMRQIDGLRALAVGSVLAAHYLPAYSKLHFLPWGNLGVRLFFVISGYLITGILLRCRPDGNRGHARQLLDFYGRRALRIFPIYYLYLGIIALLGLTTHPLWPHVCYLTNWMPVEYSDRYLVHFWTLAVEEQFYLVWPWLILLLPRKTLAGCMITCIASAPLVRLVCVLAGADEHGVLRLTPSCLDSLGFGALLALANWNTWLRTKRLLIYGAPLLGLVLVALFAPRSDFGQRGIACVVLGDLAIALVFVGLVGAAAEGVPGVLGKLISFTPIVFLGRISYGIYIYHLIVLHVLENRICHLDLGFRIPVSVAATIGTIGVAVVSWFCVELPISRLKRFLPYRKAATQPTPSDVGCLELPSLSQKSEHSSLADVSLPRSAP